MKKISKNKKLTHKQIIMNHMLTGQTISNTQAYNLYNMTDCVRRIGNLRDEGVPIRDKFIRRNGKRFKQYWIDEPNQLKINEVAK